MNWILCGFKGCGKTYFASRVGLPYFDTDALIENREGLSIREIVQTKGLNVFRKIEEDLILSLKVQGSVISIGGGALVSPISQAHLKTLGKLIYLKASKEIILKRLLFPPLPSFLDPWDPISSFEKMWSTRILEYERLCEVQINLKGKTDQQILEELWQIINLGKSFGSPPGASLTEKR